MKKKFFFSRGETLVEVLIAVFVVALGSSIATSLIVTSFQSNSLSRDNLIAMNLAEEGIEAVRAVRDTNWLKYGYDKENCWNILPSSPNCDITKKITEGYYTVEMDDKMVWKLEKVPSNVPLNLTTPVNNDPYQLRIVDRSSFSPDAQKVYLYGHTNTFGSTVYPLVPTDPQDKRFYRMIEILHVTADSMEVRSTVQWLSQGRPNSVALNLILTNYQKVKK